MKALNDMAPTSLTVVASTSTNGPRTLVTTKITNSGDTVAPMVTLSLRRSKDGSRVLPAFHSDGNFWLLPNESRIVTIECATERSKR